MAKHHLYVTLKNSAPDPHEIDRLAGWASSRIGNRTFMDNERGCEPSPYPVTCFKPFPASHEFCYLLSHLLMSLCSLYCKQYGPRSREQSNQLHSVCFHDKI